jgi:hypothetical protein
VRCAHFELLNEEFKTQHSTLNIAHRATIQHSTFNIQKSTFTMGAIHFSDMLRLLDQAYQHRTLVDVAAWEGGTGKVLHYKGWLVHHVNWRGGYIRLRNPKNRELRTLPQIFIFFINNKRVFL